MSGRSELIDPAFVARLERLEFMARRIERGDVRGDLAAPRRGPGALFREHTNYSQGDDVRFVDWNAYSRLGELLVKQFEAEENLDLTLFLDASGSMGYGEVEKLGFAKRAAALVGYIGLARQATVTVRVLPSAKGDEAPSFFGKSRVLPFLTRLESARKAQGSAGLSGEVARHLRARRSRGLALVISDFLVENGYEEAIDRLLHAGYSVGAIQVLDRLDREPDLDGRIELVDMETGKKIKRFITDRMRDEYRAEVAAWCESLASFCRSRGVGFVALDTAWDSERVLRSLMDRGGVLR